MTQPDTLDLASLGRASDWSGVRVVVAGFGVSGFAAADNLLFLGAQVTALDEVTDPERGREGHPAGDPRRHRPAGAGRDRGAARRRRRRRHLTGLDALRAAARAGGRPRHPGLGRGRARLAVARPRAPRTLARGDRHQRQDHDRADARVDPARRRPPGRRGRQRGPPDRRGGDGPRALRRAGGRALQLPAPLHPLDVGASRLRCSTSPRTTSTGTTARSAACRHGALRRRQGPDLRPRPACLRLQPGRPRDRGDGARGRRGRGRPRHRLHPGHAVGRQRRCRRGPPRRPRLHRGARHQRRRAVHPRPTSPRPPRTSWPMRWRPPRWPGRTASASRRCATGSLPSGPTATASPSWPRPRHRPGSTTPRPPTPTPPSPRCRPTSTSCGWPGDWPREPASTTWSRRSARGCEASYCSGGTGR